MIAILIIGLLFLVIGYLIRYFIGKRKFKRRAVTGLERFKSYNSALTTNFLEGILLVIAKLLIIAGFLLIGFWLVDRYGFAKSVRH